MTCRADVERVFKSNTLYSFNSKRKMNHFVVLALGLVAIASPCFAPTPATQRERQNNNYYGYPGQGNPQPAAYPWYPQAYGPVNGYYGPPQGPPQPYPVYGQYGQGYYPGGYYPGGNQPSFMPNPYAIPPSVGGNRPSNGQPSFAQNPSPPPSAGGNQGYPNNYGRKPAISDVSPPDFPTISSPSQQIPENPQKGPNPPRGPNEPR